MDSDKKKIEDYDKDILDIDEFSGTEIKVSPSYYLHMALIACQKAMDMESIEERVFAYRMAVDHLESVAKAAKLLGDKEDTEYDELLETFKQNKDYKDEEKDHVRFFKLAKYQYRVIAERIFSNQLLTLPLKM